LLNAKQSTPDPISVKQSPHFYPKSTKSKDANEHVVTPYGRRDRDELTVSIRNQNRSPNHQENSSLSTKYNQHQNRFKNQVNYSKNKG
jgi:hypothetical protein